MRRLPGGNPDGDNIDSDCDGDVDEIVNISIQMLMEMGLAIQYPRFRVQYSQWACRQCRLQRQRRRLSGAVGRDEIDNN